MRLQIPKAWPPQKLPMILSQVQVEQDCLLASMHWPVSPQLCACDAATNYQKLVLAPVSILPCCCTHSKSQLPISTKPYAFMAYAL